MLNKSALITGINGFCGKHLSDHLIQQGYTVSGIDLTSDTINPNTSIYTGDIRDRNFIRKVITSVQPTHIFHLAGLIKFNTKLDTLYDVNVRGTEYLLDAVHSAKLDPTILITSSRDTAFSSAKRLCGEQNCSRDGSLFLLCPTRLKSNPHPGI